MARRLLSERALGSLFGNRNKQSQPNRTRLSRQQARRRFFTPRIEQLEGRALLASLPVMLGDVNPGSASSVDNDYLYGHRVVEMGGLYYFVADTDEFGRELWQTDGTPAGTSIVADLAPGSSDGISPTESLWMGPDGNLYFDGGIATRGLHRLRPGSTTPEFVALNAYPNPAYAIEPNGAIFNGEMYHAEFVSTGSGSAGLELAKFDFATGQPILAANIMPGISGSYPTALTVAGDNLFFLANSDQDSLKELWRYDGEQASLVSRLDLQFSETPSLHVAGDRLYVLVTSVGGPDQLWLVSQDGTTAWAVVEEQDIFRNTVQSLNGDLMFAAYNNSNLYQIWRANALGAAPHVEGIPYIADKPGVAHVMHGYYYFFASNPSAPTSNRLALLRSNGTALDAMPVAFIDTTEVNSPHFMTSVEGKLYFLAHHRTEHFGLYESDGTSAGTRFVMRTGANQFDFPLVPPTSINGNLFFAANDGQHGLETWIIPAEKGPVDLRAHNLRLPWNEEVSWGSTFDISFEVTASSQAIDEFLFDVYVSGDAHYDGAGDLVVGGHIYNAPLEKGETRTLTVTVGLPAVPPPGFNLTGDLYIGLNLDPLEEIEEGSESNNVNQGLGIDVLLVRQQPEVLHVVTHGIDPNFDLSTAFGANWLWDYPRQVVDAAATTSLAGKTGTYSTQWNSSAGWTRALVDVVALAWLDTPDAVSLPPELVAQLKQFAEADLQFALERAAREVELTAQKIVYELIARGDLISPADRQKIHLIGHGSGAAVNARVAQLLAERGFTISLFTSIDGLAIDWPGAGNDLSDTSLSNVVATRKVNYRVQRSLDEPQSDANPTTGLEQLVSKALRQMLGRTVPADLIPDVFDNLAAPSRVPQFIDMALNGTSSDPSTHFNAASLYFAGPARADLLWLAGAPLPTPGTPAISPKPPIVQQVLDGSFEWANLVHGMIDSLDEFDAADEFTKTWLEGVNQPSSIVASNWRVQNSVELVQNGDGAALKLTQAADFATTLLRQDIFIPAGAQLTFDLELVGTPDSTDRLAISLIGPNDSPTLFNMLLGAPGTEGHHSVSLANVAGRYGTLFITYNGLLGTGDSILLDNLQIRVSGHLGNAFAEINPDKPGFLTFTATDITPVPGGVDAVRYYVETNGIAGLQVGSDQLLGTGTSAANQWRFERSVAGLNFGYSRYYAVAVFDDMTGPEASIHQFMRKPATLAYHRASDPLDVDGDGEITPLDALIVINALNLGLIGTLPSPDRVSFAFDTNPDDILEPLDALIVINYLNTRPVGFAAGSSNGAIDAGEGESVFAADEAASNDPSPALPGAHSSDVALLAWLEWEAAKKRRSAAWQPVATDR